MQEHPDYKYRPRRRKHNKRGATTGAVAGTGGAANRRSEPSRSPGGSLLQQHLYQQQPRVAASPAPTSPFRHLSNYASSGSPASYYNSSPMLHTPDSSPTGSPEPGADSMRGAMGKRTSPESREVSTLPTPEMSPMEQDKESFQFQQEQEKFKAFRNAPHHHHHHPHHQQQQQQRFFNGAAAPHHFPLPSGGAILMGRNGAASQPYAGRTHFESVTSTFYPPVVIPPSSAAAAAATASPPPAASVHSMYSGGNGTNASSYLGYGMHCSPSGYQQPLPGARDACQGEIAAAVIYLYIYCVRWPSGAG